MYAVITSSLASNSTRPPFASDRSTMNGPPAMSKTSFSIQSMMGLNVTSPGGQKAFLIFAVISSGLS